MSVSHVLAVAPVADLDAAVEWYERFFGRPADTRPMPTLADWHISDSAWVQVFHDEARAGSTLLNFAVGDMDAHLAELAGRGIEAGDVVTNDAGTRLATVTDPSGNTLTLIENPV